MNKTDAIAEFGRSFSMLLKRRNAAEIRETWNNFVDGLQKTGDITSHQANVWVNPFLSKKDR